MTQPAQVIELLNLLKWPNGFQWLNCFKWPDQFQWTNCPKWPNQLGWLYGLKWPNWFHWPNCLKWTNQFQWPICLKWLNQLKWLNCLKWPNRSFSVMWPLYNWPPYWCTCKQWTRIAWALKNGFVCDFWLWNLNCSWERSLYGKNSFSCNESRRRNKNS